VTGVCTAGVACTAGGGNNNCGCGSTVPLTDNVACIAVRVRVYCEVEY